MSPRAMDLLGWRSRVPSGTSRSTSRDRIAQDPSGQLDQIVGIEKFRSTGQSPRRRKVSACLPTIRSGAADSVLVLAAADELAHRPSSGFLHRDTFEFDAFSERCLLFRSQPLRHGHGATATM